MANRDTTRQANLTTILHQLAWEGVETLHSQACVLGTSAKTLHATIMGAVMSDAMAREIEWAVHKPERWMDEDRASAFE